MCKESGVELGGKKETMDEYWERLYSDPKKLDKDVKIVLDNLPDFETYLKCIKKDMKHITEDLIDTEDKKMASTIAVSDMLKYVQNPNMYKNGPNFVSFLERIKNSKHPTIERIFEFIKSAEQKYQNPTILNENKIQFASENTKRIKYRQDPGKR
jgi:hypothetical protein